MLTTSPVLLSPRLQVLKQELEAGRSHALETFWQERHAQGTPLLEPQDETTMLVTLLWQSSQEQEDILVINGEMLGGLVCGLDLAGSRMERLLETDLWFKTYVLPNEMRTTYRLSRDDRRGNTPSDWAQRRQSAQADPLNPHLFVYEDNEQAHEVRNEMMEELIHVRGVKVMPSRRVN